MRKSDEMARYLLFVAAVLAKARSELEKEGILERQEEDDQSESEGDCGEELMRAFGDVFLADHGRFASRSLRSG
jgi:hypothetical protein